jgi:hypothetical protein
MEIQSACVPILMPYAVASDAAGVHRQRTFRFN